MAKMRGILYVDHLLMQKKGQRNTHVDRNVEGKWMYVGFSFKN